MEENEAQNDNVNTEEAVVEETPETPEVEETEPTTEEKTFTQTELDAVVQKRLDRERAKYSDYDSLKESVGNVETLENENAELLSRAETAEANLLRLTVSNETGVPVSLLKGSTEEELNAEAKTLLEFKGAKPQSSAFENVNSSKTSGSNADLFASAMESLR